MNTQYIDANGVALAVNDIVVYQGSPGGAEFGIVNLLSTYHQDPARREHAVVLFNQEHGVNSTLPGNLVYVTSRDQRVADLSEKILCARGYVVCAMSDVNRSLDQSNDWDHEAAARLAGELQHVQALTRSLRLIDPESDYLSR